MFNKLRRKMLWFYMLTISSVILVAFAAIYVIFYNYVHGGNMDERLSKVLESWQGYSPTLTLYGESSEDEKKSKKKIEDYGNSFVLTVDKEGQIIPRGIRSYFEQSDATYEEAAGMAWAHKEGGTVTLEGRKWRYAVFNGPTGISFFPGQQQEPQSFEIVFLDITDSEKTVMLFSFTMILVGVFMLVILFIICSIFARRAIEPLEESWNQQKQFVADASHELKTPIAIVTSNLDAIEASGEETVESQKEWFGYIRTELKRLSTLITDLLYLAKSGDIIKGENRFPFDFSATVETAVTSMEAMIYEKGIRLNTHVEADVFVARDEARIRQAVLILLENAAKYTPQDGKITITLTKDKGEAIFQVQNTGDGIAPEDLSKIFDRFYRPDSSRSHETGGYGLGLSIAKTIVERAGGTISAQSDAEATTFRIGLKLYKQ